MKRDQSEIKRSEHEHLDRIRERFSSTAEPFAQFALSLRGKEAEWMAAVATANFAGAERAVGVDLACGPGTLTRPFLDRLGRVVGVDFTPAMLGHARKTSGQSGPERAAFVCANIYSLPFTDAAVDIAFCGYALHHFLAPATAVHEMTRVIRPGGRVAIIDIVLPPGADRDRHDLIERTRDSSHASTLRVSEVETMLRDAGLRVVTLEQNDRDRDFDHWMHVAGHEPDSEAYAETRRLLEASLVNDTSGFRPRLAPDSGDMQFSQTAALLVAEKA